jgi:hypothetical protein
MIALRKVVDSSALTDVFDLPPDFRDRKIEVILFPLKEASAEKPVEEKKRAFLTMTQIDEWAKVPEIQNLVGVLKGLPQDISMTDIRNMRLSEKYGI